MSNNSVKNKALVDNSCVQSLTGAIIFLNNKSYNLPKTAHVPQTELFILNMH